MHPHTHPRLPTVPWTPGAEDSQVSEGAREAPQKSAVRRVQASGVPKLRQDVFQSAGREAVDGVLLLDLQSLEALPASLWRNIKMCHLPFGTYSCDDDAVFVLAGRRNLKNKAFKSIF